MVEIARTSVSKNNPNCDTYLNYKERFSNGRDAYRWWLCTEYTDSKINVIDLRLVQRTVKNLRMLEQWKKLLFF